MSTDAIYESCTDEMMIQSDGTNTAKTTRYLITVGMRSRPRF